MDTIIYPGYVRVVIRNSDGWHFVKDKPFYNPLNFPTLEQEDIFSMLGLTMKGVANELRKINNATHGFYLANILEKKYYYCGTEWKDVERTLREDLNIGVDDPYG
ncbi:MAG: hypothetical protein KME64_08020 [Scytonematopsis contorta HA4267-MV1]|jgi:hypothetical protein|nr:hypothetical protein [Scytonematopsis contorta HA4267-MV1]